MITLSNLGNQNTTRKSPKRVGRGPGSGHGKTSCRGHKGQMSRSGARRKPGFEGGQMPLVRRLPKRGFNNARYRIPYSPVNLESLKVFPEGGVVTPAILVEKGIVKNLKRRIKILGEGALPGALEIHAHGFSESAKRKIEEAKGTWRVVTFEQMLKRQVKIKTSSGDEK